MSENKPYELCSDGLYRIKPRHKMTIGGVVCGAGTVVSVTKPKEKQEVTDVRDA